MCQNATKTAASLMAAIEPTLKSILAFTGKANTPEGKAAIAAYDAALIAVQEWKNGTPAENVMLILADFQTAFNAVFANDPIIPENVKLLINIILAGVQAVLGIIEANAPAPASPVSVAASLGRKDMASEEEAKAIHQSVVIADTTAKVQTLVPDFKPSIWHRPASQYRSTWNKAAAEVPGVELA